MRYCKTKNLKREAAENYGKHNEANMKQRALSVLPLGQAHTQGVPWGGLWHPWGAFWGLRGCFFSAADPEISKQNIIGKM